MATPVPIATPVPMTDADDRTARRGRPPGRGDRPPVAIAAGPVGGRCRACRLPLPLPSVDELAGRVVVEALEARLGAQARRCIIEPPREPIEPPREPIEKPRICACDAVVTRRAPATAIAVETDRPTIKRLSDERMAKPPSKPTSQSTWHNRPARRPDCGGFGAGALVRLGREADHRVRRHLLHNRAELAVRHGAVGHAQLEHSAGDRAADDGGLVVGEELGDVGGAGLRVEADRDDRRRPRSASATRW